VPLKYITAPYGMVQARYAVQQRFTNT